MISKRKFTGLKLGVLVIALYLRSKDWVEEFSSADVFKVLEIKVSAGLG